MIQKRGQSFAIKTSTNSVKKKIKPLNLFAKTVNKVRLLQKSQNFFMESILRDNELEDEKQDLKNLERRIHDLEKKNNVEEIIKISMLKTKASAMKKRIYSMVNSRLTYKKFRPVTVNGVKFDDVSSFEKHSAFIENSKRYRKMDPTELIKILK